MSVFEKPDMTTAPEAVSVWVWVAFINEPVPELNVEFPRESRVPVISPAVVFVGVELEPTRK